MREPELLSTVVADIGARARFIHVVRNPFDCISTMAVRTGVDLRVAADQFSSLCEVNKRAHEAIPAHSWIDVRLERLVAQPGNTLRSLCAFFGLEAECAYLERCAELVFPVEHETRHEARWPEALIAYVSTWSDAFAWLSGYFF